MPTNTGGGTTTSFTNTPQAQTDTYNYAWLTEDWSGIYCFDVMSNDLGGNAKILWSVDDGTNSTTSTLAGADLLVQDTTRAECTSGDVSANGAKIWITSDGKVGYDAGTLSASFKTALQALSAGDSATDTFVYAIRLASGTLSWTTVTIVYQGVNDGVQMAATAAAGVTEDVAISKSGTASFTDVDLHDTHTATFAAASGNSTHLGSFSLGSLTDGTSGSVGWTYNLDNAAAQYLGANDSVTETYVITVADNHGASAQQAVTVTIHGTNDGPAVVLSGDVSGAVHEDAAIGMDGKLHHSGSFGFTDVDLSDTHSVSVTPAGSGYLGTLSANVSNDSTGDGAGQVDWGFAVDNSAVQYLADGQVVTQTYTVTLDDHNGGTTSQTVTVTITGTNDDPDIKVVGSDTATANLGETDGGLTTSGTLTVVDPDTTDSVNVTVSSISVGGTGGDGGIDHDVLLGMLTLSGNTANVADGTQGSMGWSFNSGGQAFDYLPAGQTLVLTYTLTADDSHTGSDTQQVTITITGTNDAAVIGDPAVHDVTEDVAVTSGNLVASGMLSISDADTGENHFSTAVTGDPANLGSLTLAADGSYTYSVANAAVQFLAGSDANGGTSTHVDTFTVMAADGTTKQVSFTIHGANDGAVIADVGVTDFAVTEAGGDNNATAGDPNASGTLSVADTDTGENHFAAVPPASLNGTYGTFTFSDVTGAWTYTLDNDRPATQALNQGDPVTDTLTVHSADGTAHDIVVHITGANDAAVITEAAGADHGLVEAGGISNADPGDSTAGGTLSVSDVDDGESYFLAAASADLNGTYGTFSFDASSGAWTYTLDNDRAATQALNAGDPATDTLVVHSSDGTPHTITVDMVGANDTAVITEASGADHDLIEAGGIANAEAGDSTAGGTLSVADVDDGENHFVAPATASLDGTYGTFTFNESTGAWTYTLDNGRSATQALVQDQHVTDTLTVHSADGTPHDIVVSITGTNDVAVITQAAGADESLVEAGGVDNGTPGDSTAGGTLSVSDVDAGQSYFVAAEPTDLNGTYGIFTFDEATGAWTYTLDNDRGVTQALNAGDPAQDTLTVHSADGTAHDIVVNITGANDAAVITEAAGADHDLVEAGGIGNADAGDSTASGTLSVSDVDDGESSFQSAAPGDLAGTYGTFAFNEVTGAWTYALDNGRPATQALNDGAPASDTLTVRSADGTTHDIIVNITGANDAAVISEVTGGDHNLIEAGGIANAYAGDSTASGTLSVSDVDAGQGSFVAASAADLQGTYGTFTFDEATGAWTYALDNGSSATQALVQDEHVTDTLTVHSDDGTSFDVTVNITGTNDAAAISETAGDHDVTEAGGTANATAGDPDAGGTLHVTDVDAGQSTFQIAEASELNGTYGTFTFDAATGAWTYTLDNDRDATQALGLSDPAHDTLTVHSADGTAHTVTVDITGSNDAPVVAEALASEKNEGDTSYNLDLLHGASDVDDGETATLSVASIMYSVDGGPASATAPAGLSLSGSSLTVDPANGAFDHLAENQTTTITVTYDVSDVHGATVAQTETITITGTNDTPTVDAALTSSTDEGDAAYSLNLLDGASDVDDGDSATLSVGSVMYSVDAGPASATVPAGFSLTGSSLTVDPANGAFDHLGEGQHTTITVTYDVTDAHGATVPQSETITITGTNDAPVVSAGGTLSYTENDAATAIDAGLTITDVDSAMLSGATVSITAGFASSEDVLGFVAQNGISGSYNAATGVLTLTGPASVADYEAALQSVTYANSSDNPSGATRTISFQVDDGATLDHASNVATASVSVTQVNDAPTTSAVTLAAIAEDSGARLITQAELLANAADIDGPPLSATNLQVASGNGTLVDNHDGTWSYTPGADDDTSVSFSYTVTDGSLTASGSASLDITPVNDAPVATPVTLTAIAEDSGAHIITQADLLAGVTDVDNTSAQLTVTALSIGSGSGSLVDNGNGTWTYTPAADDDGGVSFSYTVSDGQLTASSTASLDITPVNDAPVATPVILTAIAEDSGAHIITQADLLAGVTDVDNTAAQLTITALSIGSGSGSLIDNGNHTWTYTPALNDDTGVTFNYTVSDGTLASSSTASLDITPVNDAPVNTLPIGFATNEDSPMKLAGLSVSDVDSGSAAITVTLSVGSGTLTASSGGNVTVTGSGTGSLVLSGSQADINAFLAGASSQPAYVPVANANGPVTLTMTTNDGGASGSGGAMSDTGTSTITIASVNDAPAGTDGSVTTLEDTARIFSAADFGFTDPNDSPANSLAAVKISTVTGSGTLTLSGVAVTAGQLVSVSDMNAGHLVYTPAVDANGSTSFTFQVQDDGGTANGGINLDPTPNTLTVNITPVNDAPVLDLNGAGAGTGATLSYTAGSAAAAISPAATIADVDSPDFNGGSLTIGFTGGTGTSADQLTIQNQGTGAGQVGVSGSNITYGGVVIGTFTGGANGANLVVTFNANATLAAAQALSEHVLYSNATSATTTKTLGYTLVDGDGTASSGHDMATATATINVTGGDTTPPTVTSIVGTSVRSGNTGTATFTVTFSENVTNVTSDDFALFGTSTTSFPFPSITNVTGSGTTWTVTVTYDGRQPVNGDRGNSLGINLKSGTDVHDSAGNIATASSFTTPQVSSLQPAGVAGSPINLALHDAADVGTLVMVTIDNMPAGWTLNGGTQKADGSWTIQTNDVASLTVTTPADYSGAEVLNVNATWVNADGSTGSMYVADNVEAYAAGNPIFAWSGDDTLSGSAGADTFVFSQPIGADTVHNFDAAADTIDLIGYSGIGSFSDVQSHVADDAAGNAVITLADGQSITLIGVSSSALTAGNFEFEVTPTVSNSGTITIGDGALLPLSGTIDNSGTIFLDSSGSATLLQLIQNGITLEGGGHVILSDSAGNSISGTLPSVTLTNADNIISGAGNIGGGSLTLVNASTIIADGVNALVIDTGSNVVTNGGTIEATGLGGLQIAGAVANSGLILADGSSITIGGDLGGSGHVALSGSASVEFAGAAGNDVALDGGTTGLIIFDHASGFTGSITGLDGNDRVDLRDMSFGADAMLSYADDGTGGGVLTVSDGTRSVQLHLIGSYDATHFTLGSDGQGGLTIFG